MVPGQYTAFLLVYKQNISRPQKPVTTVLEKQEDSHDIDDVDVG